MEQACLADACRSGITAAIYSICIDLICCCRKEDLESLALRSEVQQLKAKLDCSSAEHMKMQMACKEAIREAHLKVALEIAQCCQLDC